jgi:carboxymethylenebutenolidase
MSFAALTQPVADTTVRTSSAGLCTGWWHWSSRHDGATVRAWMARPEGQGPWPVVLLVHEIFGLHEHMLDVARRLAHLGFLVVAPDLFSRLGDPATCPSYDAIRDGFIVPTSDAQVMADLDDAQAQALAQGGQPHRVVITGFCWGGRITWLYAAHRGDLQAGVAWYGRLQGPVYPSHPQHPLDVAPTLKAPVLGLYGECDEGIPLSQVHTMQAALRDAGSPSRIEIFQGAPHAFHADYRSSHRPEAARQAWAQMLAWFDQTTSTD